MEDVLIRWLLNLQSPLNFALATKYVPPKHDMLDQTALYPFLTNQSTYRGCVSRLVPRCAIMMRNRLVLKRLTTCMHVTVVATRTNVTLIYQRLLPLPLFIHPVDLSSFSCCYFHLWIILHRLSIINAVW